MRKALIAARLIVLIPLVAAGTGACASAPVAGTTGPALVIPPPPPHVVPINTEPVLEPVGEMPGAGVPASGIPANRTARGNRDASRPGANEARPEAKPAGASPDTTTGTAQPETPPAPPVPTGPPPQLRTTESPGTEATVRATIDRARQMLRGVDYRLLSDIRKRAYDDAKKFADQGDEALRQGNVVFAQGVAVKAETLAKELAGK